MSWVSLVPSKVLSGIKVGFSANVKTKYKMTDLNFSDEFTDTPSKFPFVYVDCIRAKAIGHTFDGGDNAGNFSFQIEVFDNAKKSTAMEVAYEVHKIMKNMGFLASDFPQHSKNDTHRYTARYERVIGANDKFNNQSN